MFVYVMDEFSRDRLSELGYELLKEDNVNHIWVFSNKESAQFDDFDVPCVVSDVLTF